MKKGRLTHVILVFGVSGHISKEACEGTQLQVVVGAQEVEYHGQHALLLQGHTAQHRSPLQDRDTGGWVYHLLHPDGLHPHKLLTRLSPAVMFCSAPAAASRAVELISH